MFVFNKKLIPLFCTKIVFFKKCSHFRKGVQFFQNMLNFPKKIHVLRKMLTL